VTLHEVKVAHVGAQHVAVEHAGDPSAGSSKHVNPMRMACMFFKNRTDLGLIFVLSAFF
jgi:hypothetical protein